MMNPVIIMSMSEFQSDPDLVAEATFLRKKFEAYQKKTFTIRESLRRLLDEMKFSMRALLKNEGKSEAERLKNAGIERSVAAMINHMYGDIRGLYDSVEDALYEGGQSLPLFQQVANAENLRYMPEESFLVKMLPTVISAAKLAYFASLEGLGTLILTTAAYTNSKVLLAFPQVFYESEAAIPIQTHSPDPDKARPMHIGEAQIYHESGAFRGKRVLDGGIGVGRLLQTYQDLEVQSVVGVEIVADYIRQTRDNAKKIGLEVYLQRLDMEQHDFPILSHQPEIGVCSDAGIGNLVSPELTMKKMVEAVGERVFFTVYGPGGDKERTAFYDHCQLACNRRESDGTFWSSCGFVSRTYDEKQLERIANDINPGGTFKIHPDQSGQRQFFVLETIKPGVESYTNES
jgi:SAM-dependent methyltransferase